MPKKKFDEMVFSKIAETAIAEAENVDCPGTKFVAGLREIIEVLQSRLESARDEFGDDEDEDGDDEGSEDEEEGTGELDFDEE